MNCNDTQSQISGYVAETLTDASHEQVRDHLITCPSCKDYSLRFSSMKTDLKRLTEKELPFDLSRELSEYFQIKSASLDSSAVKYVLLAVLCLPLLGLAGFGLVRSLKSEKPKIEDVVSKESSQLARFQELKAIQARLDSVKEKNPNLSGPANLTKVKEMQPFHWHFAFEDEKTLKTFLEDLSHFGIEKKFNQDGLLVFKISQKKFEKLILDLEKRPGLEYTGRLPKPHRLPRSERDLEVFLTLNLQNEAPTAHFHAKFSLHNSFALRQKLEYQDIFFKHVASNYWILEVSRGQYKSFRSFLHQFAGLALLPSLPKEFPTPGQDKVVLSLFLED